MRSLLYRDFHKAAEAAFNERNVAALDEVLTRQGRNDPELVKIIEQMKMKLGVQ